MSGELKIRKTSVRRSMSNPLKWRVPERFDSLIGKIRICSHCFQLKVIREIAYQWIVLKIKKRFDCFTSLSFKWDTQVILAFIRSKKCSIC